MKKITQASARHYSPWFLLARTQEDCCCDCGLIHKSQYRVVPGRKPGSVSIYTRTKRQKGATAMRRKVRRYTFQDKR